LKNRSRKTKKNSWGPVTAAVLILAVLPVLGGCKKQNSGEAAEAETPVEEESTAAAKELDTDSLPANLQKMVPLMDALNLALCNYDASYDASDAEFVWNSILLAAVNSDWEEYGLSMSEDGMTLLVPKEVTEEIAFAMFADLSELPEVPESLSQAEDGVPAVSVNENGDYTFIVGDRGLSAYRAESFTDNGDGTYTATISLNGAGTEQNEIISTVYTLRERASEKDDPLFSYAVAAGEPADQLTEDKIAGIPYLDVYMQAYGCELYDESDLMYESVEEIPWFSCFNTEDDTCASLNDRIREEILSVDEQAFEEEGIWPDIRSYFFTDDTYLQAVSTVITYPNYATDGAVYSYNYDKKNKCAMTNEDGLKLAGVTEEALYEMTESAYEPENDGDVYDHAQLCGFRVKEDGTVDFYMELFIDNELADDYDRIAVYQMSDSTLHFYDGQILIPDSETDTMDPPFTHGNYDEKS